MNSCKAAFSSIELLMVTAIIALSMVSLTLYFEESLSPKSKLHFMTHPPSLEQQSISTKIVEEIIEQGQTELIDGLFSETFVGYANPIMNLKHYDREGFKSALEQVHNNNPDYNPKCICKEYLYDNMILYWAYGLDKEGIPNSACEEGSMKQIGMMLFKTKDQQIVKGTYGNVTIFGAEDRILELYKASH